MKGTLKCNHKRNFKIQNEKEQLNQIVNGTVKSKCEKELWSRNVKGTLNSKLKSELKI